jgi:Tfp pilus assembly protein PilX
MRPTSSLPKRSSKQAAALIIVLAFVVLLTGLAVAYLSRATTDRQLAHTSFHDTDADLLARSALDIVVGDFKQEIENGSPGSPSVAWIPSSPANVVPMRNGNPAIPNLIRRSVRSEAALSPDPVAGPAVGSRASTANSTNPADVSANGRSVSLARWNSHYMVPKVNPTDDGSDPITTGFTAPNYWAPDWVLVTRNGPAVETGIGSGSTALNNPVSTNGNYVVGRYAYAVYDEVPEAPEALTIARSCKGRSASRDRSESCRSRR